MIYEPNNYIKFFSHLMKIKNNQVFSIPNRLFMHHPTKIDIDDGMKKKLKIKSKYDVKMKQNYDIYHELDNDPEYIEYYTKQISYPDNKKSNKKKTKEETKKFILVFD